jgi:CBS domain-containing protein
MARPRVRAVVVLAEDGEGGLWRVVSDADVLAASERCAFDERSASEIARAPIVTIPRSDGIARAARLMREHCVTHPLVTVRNRPVGVISTLDMACGTAEGVENTPG